MKYGWEKSKEHMELVFFATLLTLAVGLFTEVIDVGEKGDNISFSFLGLLAVIFSIIIRIGYNKVFLKIHDGGTPKFVEIFQEYRTFWRYLGVSILMPLTVLAGLLLLIVPGIIWAVRFSFSPLIVVDTKTGPVKAMRESWAITKGNFWTLLGFWLVIGLINIAGLAVFGIGLLITIPISTFASVYVYRLLSQAKAGVTTAVAEAPMVSST